MSKGSRRWRQGDTANGGVAPAKSRVHSEAKSRELPKLFSGVFYRGTDPSPKSAFRTNVFILTKPGVFGGGGRGLVAEGGTAPARLLGDRRRRVEK